MRRPPIANLRAPVDARLQNTTKPGMAFAKAMSKDGSIFGDLGWLATGRETVSFVNTGQNSNLGLWGEFCGNERQPGSGNVSV